MTKITCPSVTKGSAVVATAALMLVGAACSSPGSDPGSGSSTDSGGGAASRQYTVTFVPGVTPNPFFDTIYRGMKEEATKVNIKVDYQGPPNFDAGAQTTVLNSVLTSHPDFLIVSPDDGSAIRPPVQRFLDAGIPVITVNGRLKDPSGLVSQITANNVNGGEVAGAQMAKFAGGSGTVAIINIAAGSLSAEQRVQGFQSALTKAAPNVTLAPVVNAGGNASASQTAARALLLAHPDLKGIFGVTEVNAEGAAAAVKAAGQGGKISIIAYDGTPAEVQLLKSGDLQSLIVQDAEKMGRTAIQYANGYLRGDKSAIQAQLNLENVLVTTENVDNPDVKAMLYSSG